MRILFFLFIFSFSATSFADFQVYYSSLSLQKETVLSENSDLLDKNKKLKVELEKLKRQKGWLAATTVLTLGAAGFTGYKAYETSQGIKKIKKNNIWEMTQILNEHEEKLKLLEAELALKANEDDVTAAFADLKSDLDILATQVSNLKGQVNVNKNDISALESSVINIRSRVSSLERRMTTAEGDIDEIYGLIALIIDALGMI